MSPKTFLIFLLFWLTSSLFSNVIAHPYIQIIEEDEYGLTLELTLPHFEIETRQTSAPFCQRVVMPTWGKKLKIGYPELPMTSVFVQVPQDGQITTQVLEIQDEILQNVYLCPLPKLSDEGGMTFERDDDAYQQSVFFPGSLLEVDSRDILRGVFVSRVRIFPFWWNPITRKLRYFNKIRFRVQFENGLEKMLSLRQRRLDVGDVYEGLLQRTIINYPGSHAPSTSNGGNYSRIPLGREFRKMAELRKVPTRYVKQFDALKIEITEEGIYRLSYQDLADAGLQPQWMKPEHLHLFNQGQEVAIQVNSQEPSQFQPGDTIQFYAQSIDSRLTAINVYWLYWRKKGFGKRMARISSFVPSEGEKIPAFFERLHFEKNSSLWLETPNAPEQDYWFWQRLNASDIKEYSLNVPTPASNSTEEAIVRVNFHGRSTAPPHPNHHTLIKLNGTVIGDELWDDDSPYTQEMRVSSELFVDGKNTLTIEMPGDTGAVVDVIYLNWIEIEYWRDFKAVKNSLAFNVTGNGKMLVAINQMTQADMVIYDITNPFEVAEIINFAVTGEKRNYQATFETPVMDEEKRYLISTTKQIKSPLNITPVQPARLKSPKNAADYILITAKEFLPTVKPLGELRRQQGLRVKIVSVEDIYNEFNHGLFDPAAIKDFLQYAYHNWNPPAPTYVFLVGDANINYENKRTKKGNQAPAHLSASWEGLTPDDNLYVSVDCDDILPDMFIGRIPANEPQTVTALINKIIRFEQSTRENPQKVLLVADSNTEFEDLNEGLFAYLPAEFYADKIYLRSYFADVAKDKRDEKIAQATQDIITSFNQGVMISNYIGHGVMDRWSQAKGLFKPDDVHSLNNEEQLAFALMLTCINGYFVNANKYSLAEEFLLARGGAIGAFAPSNVSYTWEDQILANAIFSSIFEQGNRVLGAITTQSKITAYEQGASQNVLQMFTLFGDPAVSLKEWQ